jgi:hypothetical protein
MKKLIYILLAIVLVSCGARKSVVNKEDIKIDSITKVEEEVSQVSIKNETLIDTTTIEEIYYEPIDSSKSFIVNGKEFKNVKIKTRKTKKGISTAKKEETVLEAKKSTLNEVSIDIETKDKETIRENGFPWWIIIVIVVLLLVYTKYKKIW